jgi:hypothetical protein
MVLNGSDGMGGDPLDRSGKVDPKDEVQAGQGEESAASWVEAVT